MYETQGDSVQLGTDLLAGFPPEGNGGSAPPLK
jgi:hypothetical protein